MSKAEEFATFMVEELIRKWVSEGRIQDSVRQASLIRECLIIGYNQAEEDLALTWEDIPKILSICENLKTSWWFRDNEQTKQIGKQPFWEEVLRRFNEERNK